MLRERYDARITIVEQAAAAGGMLRTFRTASGHPYEYGPRVVSVFRGTPEALPFVRSFVDLEERDVYQGTRLRPEFPIIPFPVDRESVRALPCGPAIERELAEIRRSGLPPAEKNLRAYLESCLGPTLTELAFEGFNRKFWGRRLDEMPADWGKLRRLGQLSERGVYRLPSEAPHHYPRGGFDPLFERMLARFDVRYGMRVEAVVSIGSRISVIAGGDPLSADVVIATAPIDEMLGYRFGSLEWRGYRLEVDEPDESRPPLGRAPDGVPFAWLYSPWPETSVCRTTDFGVIHEGSDRAGTCVITREIADDNVRMYPVWWEDAKLERYLEAASQIQGLVPLGRLGLYKYVTIDSTYGMVQRLVNSLDRYLVADPPERLDMLKLIRGDWRN